MSVLDDYLRRLDRELPGSRAVRRDLLAELRDGLTDAASTYRSAGLPAAEAEARAVADSGEVVDLAREYGEEIRASQTRRSAQLAVLAMPALLLLWDALLLWTPTTASMPSATTAALSQVVDVTSVACAGFALGVVVLLARGARAGRSSRRLAATLVAGCGSAVVLVTGSSLLMNLLAVGAPGYGPHVPAVATFVAVEVSFVVLVALLRSLWRTLRVVRWTPPSLQAAERTGV